MKRSPIRRLRLLFNVLALVLGTLLAQHFYREWQKRNLANQIVELCQLPPLPEKVTLYYSFYEATDSGKIFVAFSIAAPLAEMDVWLDQMDQWQLKSPKTISSYALRESQSTSRIDFSAEIASEAEDHRLANVPERDIPAPHVSK